MRYWMMLALLAGCTKTTGETDVTDTDDACVSIAEVCDGVDNDCDGEIDNGVLLTFYADADRDGYGLTPISSCEQPPDSATVDGDCREDVAAINPGAAEICNGIDDDCDTEEDEGATDAAALYPDADGDGFGDDAGMITACPTEGYIETGGDCDDTESHIRTTCFVEFDGTTGAAWETIAGASIGYDLWSPQIYSLPGWDQIFFANSDPMAALSVPDSMWTSDRTTAPYDGEWMQTAPQEDGLWLVRNLSVYHYDIDADAWDTPYEGGHYNDWANVTESDGLGHVYGAGYDREGLPYLLDYDTVTGEMVGLPTHTEDADLYETRLAYDPIGHAMFFGGYGFPQLFRMDLTTYDVTQLASIPESQLNDAFCGDRSGHIYAAGGDGGTTVFRYDIATDTWSPIADLPGTHGNNGACSVHADGWLYVFVPETQAIYRISLGFAK